MTTYIRCLWLALLLIVTAVRAEGTVVFTDPLKTIIVESSYPVFNIILQSNPTTGYSWVLKSYDNNLILPLSHRFFPHENKQLIGAPGYEKWTFRVKPRGFTVPQLTGITLVYLRPWEGQASQVINFRVVTNNAN